jgi:tetratricopeptide (TPR) repeat protein
LTTHERPARRHTPALIAALLVVAVLATWSGVEAFGAALRLSRNAAPPTTVQMLVDTGLLRPSVFDPASLLNNPLMRAIFGDVLSLDYVLAARLFMAGNVRAALLILLVLALYVRWTPGYYGTMAVILTGLVWDLFQILNRYTGWLAGLVGILIGLLALWLLFRAEDNFALRAVRMQVRLHPAAEGAAGAYYWGRQYAREGKHALAAHHFRHAVGRAPHHSKYYKRLGMSYAQIGRFGHSLRTLEQARKLDPDDDDIPQLQALVREKLRQAQVRQAKRQVSPGQM